MPRAIYEDSEPLLRPASGFAAARTLVPNAPTMVASAAAVKAAAITRAAPPSVYQTPPVLAPAATGDALVAGIISNAMVPTAVGAAATVLGAVGKTSPPTVRAIDAGWTPPSFGTPNAGAANPTPLPSSPPEPTITTGLKRPTPPPGVAVSLPSAVASPFLFLAAAAVAVWLIFKE